MSLYFNMYYYILYRGVSEILDAFVMDYTKYTWMSNMSCNGNEIDLTDCSYTIGGCSYSLAVKCEDIDECLSQPCENNGACVNAINGFVCSCDQGYEGYRCQNEVGDQTTLIVVLISSICVLSIVVLATVCCCLRYRREHKKTKTDLSNVLNSGKGGLQNTEEVETVQTEMEEGHYDEDVYDGIKETTVADVADYINPGADVEPHRDADGYVKFAENDRSVGYYKLKHTKTEDYSNLCVYKF
ncbi:delta-like protein B [Ruditapes philippinarum]|uniref:delta-like protein B n=1 Tax=Ruditapes philippinarum TaxID=129788 RepID=UPI00295BDC09|nr:delta-like protein B [Ruditapes philippinarum]